jgi:hypothetical protein
MLSQVTGRSLRNARAAGTSPARRAAIINQLNPAEIP